MSVPTCTAVVFDSAAQRRALLICIGVSVALHGLALFAFPGFRASLQTNGSRMLTATFAAPPGRKASIEPPAHPDRPRDLQQPGHEVRPESLRPVLIRPAAPATAGLPAPGIASSTPTPGPADVPDAPAAASARAPTTAAGASGKAPTESVDSALLEKYRLGLIDAASRYRRYPPQAMERGWQGRVEIRLVIGTDGMVKSARVKTSSSYRILDDQALDMVKKGIEFAQIPPLLRGREFTVDVPVIFELRTG